MRHACHAILQGETKRLLLQALTKSLATVLPFLEQTLERSFAAAAAASQAGQRDAAQQHVAALQAALGEARQRSGCGLGSASPATLPVFRAGWQPQHIAVHTQGYAVSVQRLERRGVAPRCTLGLMSRRARPRI